MMIAPPDIVVDTAAAPVEDSVAQTLGRIEDGGLLEESLEDRYRFDLTRSDREEIVDDLREGGYIE